MNTRKLTRILLCLFISVLFILGHGGIAIPFTDKFFSLIDRIELISYDMRLRSSLPGGVEEKLVIIDIDEESLNEIGHWPWRRNILAKMVDTLFEHYGVRVVGFDMVFPEIDTSSGLQALDALAQGPLQDIEEYRLALERLRPQLQRDHIFAKSLQNRNVVMGYVFNQSDKIKKGAIPAHIGNVSGKWEDKLPLFRPKGYIANLPILQEHAITGGFFDNPHVDIDGVFRRVPLMQSYNGKLYESLALATARLYLGQPKTEVVVVSSGRGERDYNAIELLRVGDRNIRVDEKISALVPFRGPQNSFKYVSVIDVNRKKVDINLLRDKIVLLGSTASGLMDLRATPVQDVYPGVEVHANMVAGILNQNIKHIPEYAKGFELVVLAAAALLMTIMIPFLSPLLSTAMTLGIAAVLTIINVMAWGEGVVFPIAAPLVLLVILFVFQMSYGFFIETRNKRALSKVFGQYIPPELVDELDNNPTEISLEGESREMSVLFSDVRGFTTISEGLTPKELTSLMNEFLTPLTAVIHKHRGTIDKYMGDAIMAFWGAPLQDDYHSKNALLAAIEMIEVMQQQEEKFIARGWPPLKIGIGINSGLMNVGNMGSEFRMAYTVMGDTVNLGSRLEGLTKEYGVDIIVNETVKAALPEFEFLELDRVRVKGKDKPVTIYEPLGYSIELEKDLRNACRRFNKALQAYRQMNWDTAEREIFSLTQTKFKHEIYQFYLDRIMHYRNNPPPDSWDGVFVHKTK